MTGKVSTAIVLFKKRKKKNGKYPAKLRLTHNRKQMYYNIDNKNRVYEFTEDEFSKITSVKPRGIHKDISIEFSLIEEKAQKIIRSFSEFSFEKFKTHFGISGTDLRNIYYFMDIAHKKYSDTGLGNKSVKSTKTALVEFTKKDKFLDFREITPAKLHEFEKFLREDKGLKTATVYCYASAIRTMFYHAKQENAIPADLFPFGRGKYQVPNCANIKRALKLSDIEKIYNYKPEPFTHEEEAYYLWMFTYLCNGINMKDLCNLKYKDIGSEFIYFIRKKTEHASGKTKPVTAPITKDIRFILEKLGNSDKSPDNYVFPYLDDSLTRKQKMYKIAWRVRKTNVYMQKIAAKLEINENITTYTARHSFATVLKRSGISTEFISESLGHRDVKITESYLDSFENEQKKEIAKHLTAF